MALLARVADRVYWGARYTERAEDTARIVRAFGDLYVDFPVAAGLRWDPLIAIGGTSPGAILGDGADHRDNGEAAVLHHLIVDTANPGSISASVAAARENLRTTREVMPREAWQAINQMSRFVRAEAPMATDRRSRDWFLGRVTEISRRLDGVLESTMSRDAPYRMWRLGRLVERADMTTRVIGVRAAALLGRDAGGTDDVMRLDEVEWMGVLRSLSALQMYQRAARRPIEASAVLRFLLFHEPFPRSVRGCLSEIRRELQSLPGPAPVLDALSMLEHDLAACAPDTADGGAIDRDMDRLQRSISALDRAIADRYMRSHIAQ